MCSLVTGVQTCALPVFDDWLLRTIGVLEDRGCDEVTVVLGAAADQARVLLEGSDVAVVVAADWAQGMGASLRAGLSALPAGDAALVSLADLPDVGPGVVRRLLAAPFVSTARKSVGRGRVSRAG